MSSRSEGGSASDVDSCSQGSSGFSALSLEDLTNKSYFLRSFLEVVDRRALVQASQEIRWDCADFAVPDLV